MPAEAIGYDELVRSVPIWLYATNNAIVTEMPQIIHDAIDEIMLLIDHDLFATVLDLSTTIGPPSVPDVDTDYSILDLTDDELGIMEVRTIQLKYRGEHDWTSLQLREYTYLSALYSRNRPSRPRFYANYGATKTYKVFPYPDREYSAQLLANVRPPYLDADTDTNMLTEEFPTAVKNMVLKHGAIFMKNAAMAQVYGGLAADALGPANMAMSRRRRDEAAQRPQETANAVGR